jgi:hypothetical protein
MEFRSLRVLFKIIAMIRIPLLLILLAACTHVNSKVNPSIIYPNGKTVSERIRVPQNFHRLVVPANSFAAYLREVHLKPDGSLVHYYNGAIKQNDNIYAAVFDIDPGPKNLMQCADAVMRLRAEYLYSIGQFDKIHFTFTNGFRADYSKWEQGYRISVKGNKATWVKTTNPSDDYAGFRAYLDVIFSYCGTLSLSRELKHVGYEDMLPGDVLIFGSTPGHAEIVMDVAENASGKKIYLLAQGYMPAQDIQLLLNPTDNRISPWYELNTQDKVIITPQYNFTTNQLMRFE